MNFVDFLILIPIVYGIWKGFRKGFIIELFTLLALLVGIYAGIHFSDFTSNWLRETFCWESDYLPPLAFTLTFLAVGAMVFFAGKAIEQALKVTGMTPLNKIAGMFFGLIKMLYAVGVIVTLFESYDEKGEFISDKTKEKSLLYQPIFVFTTTTIPSLKESAIFLKEELINGCEVLPNVDHHVIKE